MSNLATTNNELLQFTKEQTDLIKSQIAKDCTNDELSLFLYQCKRTGLDPLTRQIYAIKRSGRMTIQTSIDGFRVIAERSGTYAGQDEPIWVDDEKGHPIKCTVTVYRFAPNGQRYPAGVGVAHFKEYYPNPMNLQKSMPHTMISKVAEALALRKAFPQDLSGLYTADEMNQANVTAMPVMDEKHPKYQEAYDKIISAKGTLDVLQQHFIISESALEQLEKAQVSAIKGLCDQAKLTDEEKNEHVMNYMNEGATAEAIVNGLKERYNIKFLNQL